MNEVMLEEIVNRYFPTCRSMSRDTLARVKQRVLEKMHQKVKNGSVAIAPNNPDVLRALLIRSVSIADKNYKR